MPQSQRMPCALEVAGVIPGKAARATVGIVAKGKVGGVGPIGRLKDRKLNRLLRARLNNLRSSPSSRAAIVHAGPIRHVRPVINSSRTVALLDNSPRRRPLEPKGSSDKIVRALIINLSHAQSSQGSSLLHSAGGSNPRVELPVLTTVHRVASAGRAHRLSIRVLDQ